MTKMRLFEAGDLVIPRLKAGIKRLALWSEGENPQHVVAEIKKGEILTVIRVEKFDAAEERIHPEWSKSACLLLSARGEVGWTGAGWVKKIVTNDL